MIAQLFRGWGRIAALPRLFQEHDPMAFEYEIDDTAHIVRLRSMGEFDATAWERMMRTVMRDPAWSAGIPILYDIRGETTLPPPGESARLTEAWRRLVPGSPVALVTLPGGAAYGVARQLSARSSGQIEAFTDPDEAEVWLASHRDAAHT